MRRVLDAVDERALDKWSALQAERPAVPASPATRPGKEKAASPAGRGRPRAARGAGRRPIKMGRPPRLDMTEFVPVKIALKPEYVKTAAIALGVPYKVENDEVLVPREYAEYVEREAWFLYRMDAARRWLMELIGFSVYAGIKEKCRWSKFRCECIAEMLKTLQANPEQIVLDKSYNAYAREFKYSKEDVEIVAKEASELLQKFMAKCA